MQLCEEESWYSLAQKETFNRSGAFKSRLRATLRPQGGHDSATGRGWAGTSAWTSPSHLAGSTIGAGFLWPFGDATWWAIVHGATKSWLQLSNCSRQVIKLYISGSRFQEGKIPPNNEIAKCSAEETSAGTEMGAASDIYLLLPDLWVAAAAT